MASNGQPNTDRSSDLRLPLLEPQPVVERRSTLLTVCPFILGNEFCERLAYYGLATNLVVYFQKFAGTNASGAVAEVGLWSGSCYVTPLLGAWLADSYFGRYKTIFGFTMIYFVGLVALSLHPILLAPEEYQEPTPAANWLLYGSLYTIALGTGGIKPNVSAFGADQFDVSHPRDRAEKNSFFNWFYFAINVGSLLASVVVVYIQENVSWSVGFAIPAVALGVATVTFWAGNSRYKHTAPKVSPLARMISVMWTAFTTTRPSGDRRQLTDWLDRATLNGKFTLMQVSEVRAVLRVMPVFFTSVVYWTVYQQMSSVFVEQGMQMDRTVFNGYEIPAASLSTFDTVAIIALVPIFDRGVYPFFASRGFKLSMLQRMGWGLLVAALAMIAAAMLETYRLQVVHAGFIVPGSNPPAAQVSVWWQTPQYVLIGASEVLASIAQLEFFYSEAPAVMRSCAMALQLLSSATGMYLSSGIVYLLDLFTQRVSRPPQHITRHKAVYTPCAGLRDTCVYKNTAKADLGPATNKRATHPITFVNARRLDRRAACNPTVLDTTMVQLVGRTHSVGLSNHPL
eukprot:4480849-Pyramimonas_sp.AAC.1